MFFFHGRIHTLREARRRAAVLVASERLEALKAANAYWDYFAPEAGDPGFDPNLRYYIVDSGSWDWIQPADPADPPPESARETKTVDNNTEAKMVTEAQWIDDDGGPIPVHYLKITVTLEWVGRTTDTVSLTTLIAER